MNISQLRDSKFLRKEDCGKGVLLTIDRIEQTNVAMNDQPEELKHILCFQEDVKPMILNTTNATLIASVTGSDETDDWHGHQIVAYNDPTVMNRGKVTGGIRVRAPKRQPPRSAPAAPAPAPARPAPAPEPLPPEMVDDDVPF
jgi:hypothetical protein